jgi:hypothetical protein
MGGDLSELDAAIEDLKPGHPDFTFATRVDAKCTMCAEAVRIDGGPGLYVIITASADRLRAALGEAA